jgi:Skp family chaperone for outer membrane proteins
MPPKRARDEGEGGEETKSNKQKETSYTRLTQARTALADVVRKKYKNKKQKEKWLFFPVTYKMEKNVGLTGGHAPRVMPPMNNNFEEPQIPSRGKWLDVMSWLTAAISSENNRQIFKDEIKREAVRVAIVNRKGVDYKSVEDVFWYSKKNKWWSPTLWGNFLLFLNQSNMLSLIFVGDEHMLKSGKSVVSALINVVFPMIITKGGRNSPKKVMGLVDEMVEFMGLLFGVVYEDYDPSMDLSNFDSNTVTSFYSMIEKTKFKDIVYTNASDVQKQERYEQQKRVWRGTFSEIDKMKTIREKDKSQRQTMLLTSPTVVDEADIWEAVTKLCQVVFDGVDKWDKIEIDKGQTSDKAYMKRMGCALCLLQLGVGSRSKGIIGVNEIDLVDSKGVEERSEVEEAKDLFGGYGRLVTVRRLTKDKDVKLKAVIAKNKAGHVLGVDGDADNDIDDFLKAAETQSEMRNVTKPLQYYFFDPMQFPFTGKTPEDRLERWASTDTTTHDPRRVFFALLRTVRDNIRYHCMREKSGVKWRYSRTGGDVNDFTAHWAITPEFDRSSEYKKCYSKWYKAMTDVIHDNLLRHMKNLKNRATHELRRLYVCYAYQQFGARTMKEVAFANRVLMHESFNTTLFYTSLQIRLMVGGTHDHVKKQSQKLTQMLNQYKSIITDNQKEIEELKRDMQDLASHERKDETTLDDHTGIVHTHSFETMNKGRVDIERLLRVHRNEKKTKAFFVQRGVVKAKELFERDVLISRKKLVRLGVNTNIVSDVIGTASVKELIKRQASK